MQTDCPEWASRIGHALRLITNEIEDKPARIASLLKQIAESEAALRRDAEDDETSPPKNRV
jgi:hypothetical protein